MPIRLVPAGAKIFNPLNRQTFIFTKPAEDEAFAEFDVLLHEGGASDVKDTAQQSAQEHGQQVAQDAQEQARYTREQVSPSG